MPGTYVLDGHFEAFIQGRLEIGRYDDAGEVLRDALRMTEDRERRLSALDASLARGLADLEAGRAHDADAAGSRAFMKVDFSPTNSSLGFA